MIYKIIYIPSKPWEKTNEHPLKWTSSHNDEEMRMKIWWNSILFLLPCCYFQHCGMHILFPGNYIKNGTRKQIKKNSHKQMQHMDKGNIQQQG